MAEELFRSALRGYDKDDVLIYLDKLISVHEQKEEELKAQLEKSSAEQRQLQSQRDDAIRKYNETAQRYNALVDESHRALQDAEALRRQLAEARASLDALNSRQHSETDNAVLHQEAARQYEAVVSEAQKKASRIVADAILEAESVKGRAEKALAELDAAKAETATFLTQAKHIFGEGVDGLLARLGLEPVEEAAADAQDADAS